MDQKLLKIFQDVFNNPNLIISEDSTAADVDGWDSFNHINLIMAIEEAYSISFSTKEIGQMAHVGDLIKLIKKKVAV